MIDVLSECEHGVRGGTRKGCAFRSQLREILFEETLFDEAFMPGSRDDIILTIVRRADDRCAILLMNVTEALFNLTSPLDDQS